MHDSMMSAGGMGNEHHQTQEDGYGGNDGWVDINVNYTSPQHNSPMFEQGGFGFLPQIGQHGMPMEPSVYSPRNIQPHPTFSHPQLLPINTNHATMHPANQPTWPSQLTNPSLTNPSYSTSPPFVPITAVPAQIKSNGRNKSPTTKSSTPRKTLTDGDRRQMCVIRHENPSMKQTEIGAMFGIERSTVSKVLRNKEKYMCPEDRSLSPVKRTKSKHPDVEKGVLMWARKQTKEGRILTDSDLRAKAEHFAMNDEEHLHKWYNGPWLEKFKQKAGISRGKLVRRASETNIQDTSRARRLGSRGLSVSHAVNETAPTSPTVLASPSSLSGTPSSGAKDGDDIKIEGMNNNYFFPSESSRYKHTTSQSSVSLASSSFTDHGPFSAGPASPSTPFSFSPDSNLAPWNVALHTRSPSVNAHQRPRSQTFPMLGIDPTYISTHSNEPLTPKYLPVTAPSSALDSPMNEMAPPFGVGIDSTMSSPHLHHSSSNGSMGPPTSVSGSGSGMTITGLQSPPNSSANSPTSQDDARRALDTLLSFIQQAPSGFVDNNEYMAVLKLTEKLRIQPSPSTLPGGLHRIAEQDCEMAPKMEHSMSAGGC